jgi:hypothetical protein
MSGAFPNPLGGVSLDRAFEAVREVRLRLEKATVTLQLANIPYAVIGANAVWYWVEQAGQGAGRNTPDIDVLLRRQDLERARNALAGLNFDWQEIPANKRDGKPSTRAGVLHVVVAGERVHPTDRYAAPEINEVVHTESFHVLRLDPLVRMKLLAYRLIDQVHLLDLIGVGAIDSSWLRKVPPDLAPRLQKLLDDPNG